MTTESTDRPDDQDDRVEPVPGAGREDDPANSLAAVLSELAGRGRERSAIQREIAQRSIAAAEAGEQRQFELSLKQFEYADIQHQRRYGLGRLLLLFAGIAVLILLALIGLVVAMAFFGSATQSQTAITMLGYGFAAIGGGGILFLIIYAVNSLTRWWQKM